MYYDTDMRYILAAIVYHRAYIGKYYVFINYINSNKAYNEYTVYNCL